MMTARGRMGVSAQRRTGWVMPAVAATVLALAVLVWLAARAEPAAAPPGTATPPPATASATPAVAALGAVAYDGLPPEARETLRLIERGGPFPYRQDGAEFQNRERRLPLQGRGYYREYTVQTPGSPDRGARRIVTGRSGEIYYTDDHYDSFRRVTLP